MRLRGGDIPRVPDVVIYPALVSALLTAIFTVSCCLQLRNTLSLDGQILGIRTIFNGLER